MDFDEKLKDYGEINGMRLVNMLSDEEREHYENLAKARYGEERYEGFSERMKKERIFCEIAKRYDDLYGNGK